MAARSVLMPVSSRLPQAVTPQRREADGDDGGAQHQRPGGIAIVSRRQPHSLGVRMPTSAIRLLAAGGDRRQQGRVARVLSARRSGLLRAAGSSPECQSARRNPPPEAAGATGFRHHEHRAGHRSVAGSAMDPRAAGQDPA